MAAKFAQVRLQRAAQGSRVLERPFLPEQIQARERGGACDRVARVRVTVKELASRAGRAPKGFKDRLAHDRRRNRQGSAAQAFADADDVRPELELFERKH